MSDFFARTAAYSYHLYLNADSGGQFWLSATDGEGPVLLRDALTPLPRYMLPEYRLNREETPIRASRLLVVRDTLLKAIGRGDAPGVHLHMGDEVELALMADPDQGLGLTFFLDGERSSLIGRLPEGALYLEPGWFGRFVDAGYELIDMPGFEEDDLDWIGRRVGPEEWEELLVRTIPSMRGRGLVVSSEIEYSAEPAGRIDLVDCGDNHAVVEVSRGANRLRIAGLEGYVLQLAPSGDGAEEAAVSDSGGAGNAEAASDAEPAGPVRGSAGDRLVERLPDSSGENAGPAFLMRPALGTETVSRLFGSADGGTVSGEALAEFARLVEREWGPLIAGRSAAKFRDLHRLYDAADWSWSLRGGPVLERGVGVVHAEPVLSAGGRLFTAAELIDAWSAGRRYLRLEDGWIDLEAPEFARSLREHGAGGGSAGLISAGFSYRQRLGLPGEAEAGELPLALEGPKPAQAGEERPALAHLRYLAGWGMNGGLYGGAERWLAELAAFAAETLAAAPDCRLVVVGRRDLLTALAEAVELAAGGMAGDGEPGEPGEGYSPLSTGRAEEKSSVQGGSARTGSETTNSDPAPDGGLVERLQRWADERPLRGDSSGNEEESADSGSAAGTGRGMPLPSREADGSSGHTESRSAEGTDASDGGMRDSAVTERTAGLILRPVSQLQKGEFEDKLQADILLLLEPDASVRSDETRLFSRIDSAEARVRIAVYSDEGSMNDARVRAVQIRLLKLYDSLTRSFLLLDPGRGAAVPGGRPPLQDRPEMKLSSWKKDAAGMAEMFVDEAAARPEAPVRRGMSIPPRAPGAWPQPDPRDTQTSRPQPERSAPVPRRRTSSSAAGEVRPVRPVQPQSAEREFVRRARETAERTEEEVPFAPFSSYWPTFAAMKPEQEHWYFYWRTEFRRGEKVETDLSYLFIYIYELINGIGWEHPHDGLEMLIRVWESYRARFRRLDGYMADWVREFALVHALDLPESPALEQTSGLLAGELLDLELSRRFEGQPGELTWELIARLSDYDVTTSRFYKDAGKKTLPRVLPLVVQALDEHLIRSRGIRLTGLFREADIRITERYLFRSVVYDPELYGRTFLVRAPKFGLHAQLRDFITQVIRQTENELRARFKFGGRLRGIKLDPELAEVIAGAVEREFLPPEERRAPEPPKLPEVRFDLEELEKLRRDSDEVLRMLTGELMASGSPAEPADLGQNDPQPVPPADADQAVGEDSAAVRADEAAGLSVPEVSQRGEPPEADEYEGFETLELPEESGYGWAGETVPGALSFEPEESRAAGTSKEAAPEADSAALSEAAAPPRTDEAGCGEASDRSAAAPEAAAPPSGAEPHSDSLPADSAASDGWDVSALDSDWQDLAARLGPAERAMIRAVLLGSNEAQRMAIAGASGELPETMIDRINEAAMEAIGDLLIDGGEVLEEYLENLAGLRPE
ncbi:TerB N-terminal domain-containing protein [Saccharibacillus qingshengii]|uniref:TerB N-terminal domain-containing protein n=1 Tax=Saccharibacillus qingshengii TaxID=1763540 RepID=UPI0015552197|nr:TerB N-terminal domain-containing protein [Saccharibacillus qingshengii]